MTNIRFNPWIKFLILIFCFSISNYLNAEEWQRTEGPYGGFMRAIAVTTNGTILAGGANGIVYRSTNNGVSWSEYGPFSGIWWNNSVRCFANTNSHGIFVAGDRGYIYSSTDDGVSWNSILGFIPTLGVYSLAVNDSGYMFAGTPDGFYRSSDFGTAWMKDTTITTSVVWATVIYPHDSVFVLTENGAYISHDRGINWNKISSTGGRYFSMNINGDFYAANYSKLVRSSDFGRTWLTQPNIFPYGITALHNDSLGNLYIGAGKTGIIRMKYNSTIAETLGLYGNTCGSIISYDPSTLYTTTLQGSIYLSNDSGVTWTRRNNGITGVSIWRFSHSASSIMYGCSYMDGIFRSSDNGYSWNLIGLEGKRLWAVEGSGDSIVFAVTDSGLFRSTNIGKTWHYHRKAMSGYSTLTSNKNGVVFLTTETGVARTVDGGTTWTDLSGVIPRYVYCNDDERLFAFGSLGLQYSTNNGDTWTYRNFPQSVNNPLCVAANGNDLLLGTTEWVLRSTNMGLSWTNDETMWANPVLGAVITKEKRFFVSSQARGVSEYDTATSKWNDIAQVLPTQWVHTIALNSLGNLIAATEGIGVFRTISFVTSVENSKIINSSFYSLSQNYPNPFNPSTTIEYYLPKKSRVKIIVFDMLGREVRTLVEEDKSVGTHQIQFNANNLSSGVYYYQLQTSEFAQTKKFILLR